MLARWRGIGRVHEWAGMPRGVDRDALPMRPPVCGTKGLLEVELDHRARRQGKRARRDFTVTLITGWAEFW